MAEPEQLQMSHDLNGCDWGRELWLGERRPCPHQATDRRVIYGASLPHVEVKVCPQHRDLLDSRGTLRGGSSV